MSYTSLLDAFSYKTLITWQLWDQMGENNKFNLRPEGTVMVFFQASAPLGWTKITDHNDAALRVVSGAGGGSAGTDPISAPTHNHTASNHTHDLADGAPNENDGGGAVLKSADGGMEIAAADVAAQQASWTTDSQGAGASGAPSVGLKFIDVILASKDA